jgi:hypothetical protein
MPDKLKIRSPEQKLRKMLKEERIIMDLELAIKKEQFRNIQKTKQGFYEVPMENKCQQMASVPVHRTNVKISYILNFLLDKIGF